ncbi:recombinase family protein [Mesobacillus maritimus]|uniref:recombinase family protein n=1 Tax=Mesobacillus maritimus TaxID=1643336 RepID=UPI002040D708|nr:recombinase family protein [Mesobacillus maritimus]MCM3668616.1 recombinase family protein [Mesobacillus maritimus]
MSIGYMRPSLDDPKCTSQREKLTTLGCELFFEENHSSPKKRVELKNMMNTLKQGDKLIINRLSTLADSTRHLVELFEMIDKKGANLYCIQEDLDTSKEAGYSFQSVLKHIVDFQSDLISERTKQGLSEAKKKGVSTGRPRKPDENVARAIDMYQSNQYTLAQIKEATGISKSTLYRYLEQ